MKIHEIRSQLTAVKFHTFSVQLGLKSERDHLEDPGLDGRLILTWIFTKRDVGGMDWIELA
jgi:hypothetical protein